VFGRVARRGVFEQIFENDLYTARGFCQKNPLSQFHLPQTMEKIPPAWCVSMRAPKCAGRGRITKQKIKNCRLEIFRVGCIYRTNTTTPTTTTTVSTARFEF